MDDNRAPDDALVVQDCVEEVQHGVSVLYPAVEMEVGDQPPSTASVAALWKWQEVRRE